MAKPFLLLVCLSLCFTSYAQKGDTGLFIYEYEKIIDVFTGCDVYVCTTNGKIKESVIENRGIPHLYSKEQTKELIDGIQALLDSKTGKTKNGKRESMFLLSDGKTRFYFDEKDACLITFGPSDMVSTFQVPVKRLLEGLKVAYEKL